MKLNLKKMCLSAAFAAATFGGAALLPELAQLRAENPAVPLTLPSGKELIEKFIAATGGRDAYAKVTSRNSAGTFDVPAMNLRGTFTLVQAAPDRGYMVIDLPGIGKTERGGDGQTFWERNPMQGVRLLDGPEAEEMKRQFMFDADLNWEKFYKSAVTIGEESVDNRPAYKVKLVSTVNDQVSHFYYDKETGLLVRMEMSTLVQGNPIPVVSSIGGYQDFGGIKIPTLTSQQAAGIEQKITITGVEHNKPIDPKTFDLPADVKALKDKLGLPPGK